MSLSMAATSQDKSDGGAATSDADLLTEIKERRAAWKTKREEWKSGVGDEPGARMCFDFAALHQWSDDDMEALKNQGRPPVTFDRIGSILNVIAGLEVSNRQEVRYIPRELGDANVNEIYTSAGQWVRDECNAEDEESEAFYDMAVCGEGWTETRLDYEYDPDGAILIERVDPMEMLPASDSRKKNYADMNGLIRDKLVDPEQVKAWWPDKEDEIDTDRQLAKDEDDDLPGHTVRVPGDQYKAHSGGSSPNNSKQVMLTEYQVKRREAYYRVADPQSGEVQEMEVADYKKLASRMKVLGMPLQAVKQSRCRVYRAFTCGDTVLEYKPCPDPTSFTYKAMTDKRDRNKSQWYGVVKGMIDPQRWTNKWLSQSMHILNTNAKGGVMYEKSAVENIQKFESSWADPRQPTQVADGALQQGRIQPKVPPPFPTQLDNLLQFAMDAIHGVSGVSPELLGAANRDQPAQLEYQRKQAGITILASLFDALRKYRKEQGKTLLYMIQTYISDDRLIRVVGQDMAKYVPLTKQPGSARFDVIIDESPNSPNQKERTWAVLRDILPLMAKMNIPPPQSVIDYLPLPQSLIDKIKQPPSPEQQQEAQAAKQLEMRERAAKAGRDEAAAMKDKADAMDTMRGEDPSAQLASLNLETEKAQADIGLVKAQIAKVLADIQAEGQNPDANIEAAKLIMEGRRIDLEREDMVLKDQRERLSIGLQHQRETEATQLQHQRETQALQVNAATKLTVADKAAKAKAKAPKAAT